MKITYVKIDAMQPFSIMHIKDKSVKKKSVVGYQ